ncbi:MAG TPA: hypothetical protein VKS82_06240 [Streptosporangiaceae bacterium]|nr:hypothetical protein [Streptosporangiaceae bacterium]
MNLYQPGPLWTEDEYQQLVAELVAEESPTVFAVVEDRDDRQDGRIAAWVLEFPDETEVICTDGVVRMSLSSVDRVLARFGRQPGVTARLVRTGHPEPGQ